MDFRQLQRFVTVAEIGSFNKAADYLALSQPSLTRSIQLLEEMLEAQLFARGPRGIQLTPAGQKLLPHARIILHERERAVSAIDSIRSGAGAISIGAEVAFTQRHLPDAILKFSKSNPDVRLHIMEGDMTEMLDQVRDGRINILLGTRAPFLDLEDVSFDPVGTESASLLMRSKHPLASIKSPQLKDFVAAQWIVSQRTAIREGWAQMFARAKLPTPSAAFFTSSLHLTKACLLKGDYVSLGNHSSYAEEIALGTLIRVDLGSDPYSRPVGIFRREGSRASKPEKQLVAILREICRESAASTPRG